MKINNYSRYFWWNRWVSRQKSSPHKLKNITDYIRSKCLLAILRDIERTNYKLPQLNYRLGIKTANKLGGGIDRDEFGKTMVIPEPVYSKKHIARIQILFWSGLAFLCFIGLAESIIFVTTASTFMSASEKVFQVFAGTLFAVGTMFSLSYAFSVKKKYLEAVDRHKNGIISDNELKYYRRKRNYAHVVSYIMLAGVLCAGVSRIFFFMNSDHTGMTDAERFNAFMAENFAAIFTLLFTMGLNIYIAFFKQDFSKVAIEYLHYWKWRKTNSVIDSCTGEFIKYAKRVQMTADQQAHIYWQHVIDIKGLFHDAEYDGKFNGLHDEYWTLRSQPGFVVTDEVYQKYALIQSAYEELFIFGIINDKMIRSKIAEAGEMMDVPKGYVTTYTSAIEDTGRHGQPPAFSANGTSKKEVKFSVSNSTTNTIVALVACFASAFFTSCNKTEPKPVKNIITGMDISGSRTTGVIDEYKDIVINHVIPSTGRTGRVVVLPIDSGSLQSGQEVLYSDFSLNNYIHESAGQNKDKVASRLHSDSVIAVQHRFTIAFDGALADRKALNGGTDIIGAFETEKKYYLPGHDNIIAILCDMLIYANYGKGLVDFEHNLNDTTEIEGMLAKVPTVDLHGFKIIIFTGKTTISSAKYRVIEQFWKRWFVACHADLRLYTSGSTSLLDKELSQ